MAIGPRPKVKLAPIGMLGLKDKGHDTDAIFFHKRGTEEKL